jgi:beta-galactosidase
MRRLAALFVVAATALGAGRTTTSFDDGWQFLKADAPGAEAPDFDDHAWRTLRVPHDWSIEGPFDEKNPTGGAGAFLPAGIGWYRKHFTAPADGASRRVFIEFDGVMANSDVWINGFHLGKRPFGYSSFRYELTGHLKTGSANVIAVRADNSGQPASRWYAGAGIYRHVRVIATDAVHLDQWATFVSGAGPLRAQSAVRNQSAEPRTVAIRFTVIDPEGRSVAAVTTKPVALDPGTTAPVDAGIEVKSPQQWSLEHPVLYKLKTEVIEGKAVLDDETTRFGIREARFDAATGFWLNGKNFKLKGVCLHHEAGGLGAAVPDRAWERRLLALKALGVNAIRSAHYPPSPVFLDLCDRLGLLVMDESFDVLTVS